MADIDHGHAGVPGQIPQQLEYMCLRCHVEAACRLVQQQRLGLSGKGHGDGNPLLLAAGKLVRVSSGNSRRIGKPNLTEQLDHPRVLLFPRYPAVETKGFANLSADPKARG